MGREMSVVRHGLIALPVTHKLFHRIYVTVTASHGSPSPLIRTNQPQG